MQSINILIVGVGGQGTLLTSRVLGNLASDLGYDVKVSEVHGMAQRGGSVVTHVRFGNKVYSPLIEVGKADILLSFEKMEALRWVHYLKERGMVITNDQSINPMPVITGAAEYPDDILDGLKKSTAEVININALDIAKEIGNIRVTNSVLLGVLAKYTDIDYKNWEKALSHTVPPRTVEINLKAFDKGYNARG
ncbi:MAG: indolepyruvate oxidoreductase subunit beta [Clostridiales bacterium]|jgi:indolepyruvate ferredoxin oxidoreductase beta subunit|nr:indolepyruvate oxidoreductase subunit beta [Clostridiales bacterium]